MESISYLFIPAGIIVGLIIVFCNRKKDNITYKLLDKISIGTNIVLVPLYLVLSFLIAFLASIPDPEHSGFLGILGWIGAVLIAAAPVGFGAAIGASTALRRKGKTVAGFLMQFAGLVAFGLSLLLFVVFDEIGLLNCSLN